MTRADFLVAMLALGMLPFLYNRYWEEPVQGEDAEIMAGDDKKLKVSLNTNRRLNIEGPLGTSVLEVQDGRIRFVSSPCRGKQCIHSGWLQNTGDFAACLPNHISVTVRGNNRLYDAINF
jgi:hypothetical protein